MNYKTQSLIQKPNYFCGFFLFALLTLSALYMYLLSSTIVQVVMQKQISSEIHELNSDIAKLESEYIEKQHALSREVASLDGFVSVENKIFINKSDTGLALSAR